MRHTANGNFYYGGRGDSGFSLAELVTVLGVIAVIMTASAPFFLSYLRASALQTGAEEMATVLNRARQIAIRDNRSVCVTSDGTSVLMRIPTCPSGAAWTGPGTTSTGVITLANSITVSGPDVTFTYLGMASTAGDYTVTNPRDGRTMHVSVTAAGRVTIGP